MRMFFNIQAGRDRPTFSSVDAIGRNAAVTGSLRRLLVQPTFGRP